MSSSPGASEEAKNVPFFEQGGGEVDICYTIIFKLYICIFWTSLHVFYSS